MKKVLSVLAIAASLMAVDAYAQVKSPSAAKAAVEKAEAATTNPKQSTKAATWVKYGETLVSAYDAPVGNVWVGMQRAELEMLGGGERPSSEEAVTVGGRPMIKLTYASKDLYFNEAGQLELIVVTQPVIENVLDKAIEAYVTAQSLDEKGQKTKDIRNGFQNIADKYSDEAYNAYSFGDYAGASELFEKAYKTAGQTPLNQLDTNALYNAAFTAWAAGSYERAEVLYVACLDNGYHGDEGDVYAKLGDIASRAGNTEKSKEYLETGFAKYPQSQSLLVGLINYYVTSNDSTDRLFELLDEAKKNEPNNASLFYVEGNIHSQLGNSDAAVAAYRKCSEIDPKYYYGYIGEGIHFYDKAVDLQNKAAEEMDDAKYTALMGEFEVALKSCIEPFEMAFELCNDTDIKLSIAEYLKNACFRFRTSGDEYVQKYEKYSSYNGQ